APCVFIQAASGDNGPREGYVDDPAVADRNGRQLAYAALSALVALPAPGTRFEYRGPVVSGATLGAWAHAPLPPEEMATLATWHRHCSAIDLDYRPDLARKEEVETDLVKWKKM